MNLKIKFRESFRPFAPSVLNESAHTWFDIEESSPYMLITVPVSASIRKPLSPEDEKRIGINKLRTIRSELPAITHVDYSARIQTVSEKHNPRFYHILQKVREKTGYGVVINTSFNVRGEPIVCTPRDAFNCFMNTEMDVLVLGNYLLEKEKQPNNVVFDKKLTYEPD